MCRLCIEKQSKYDLIEIFSENGQLKELCKKIYELFHVEVSIENFMSFSISFLNENGLFIGIGTLGELIIHKNLLLFSHRLLK